MSRPLPPDVRKRIAQMMPLLSSDNTGECAAAAMAMGRLLKANGLDWHDLTAAFADTPVVPPQAAPAARSRPTTVDLNLTPEQVQVMVAMVRKNHPQLDARAKAFLEGQLERAKYGRVLFTTRQWKVMTDLLDQAGLT